MQEPRRAFRAPVRLDRNFSPPRPSYGRRYPVAPDKLQRRLLPTKGKPAPARTNEKRFAFDKFGVLGAGLAMRYSRHRHQSLEQFANRKSSVLLLPAR